MGAGRTQFDNGQANQNRNQDVDIGNDPSAGIETAGIRYTADVSTTAFEVDLFGRLQSLSDAALNRYFGTEAAARATRLTLIGDVADAWLTYAADRSLLKLAEDTATNAREQVKLTRLRLDGMSSAAHRFASGGTDPCHRRSRYRAAENRSRAGYQRAATAGWRAGRGRAAAAINRRCGRGGAQLPAGLNSAILLRRPDVMQAEYELRAANAEIGAARAALFPRITLTGLAGLASDALSTLFTGAAFNYSAGANVRYSLFAGGAAQAGVAQTEARRNVVRL